jgi:hypothetical protein
MGYITLSKMGASGGLCSQLQIFAGLSAVAKANNMKISRWEREERPVLQAQRNALFSSRITKSKTASLMASAILSGCPSDTDSLVNK